MIPHYLVQSVRDMGFDTDKIEDHAQILRDHDTGQIADIPEETENFVNMIKQCTG